MSKTVVSRPEKVAKSRKICTKNNFNLGQYGRVTKNMLTFSYFSVTFLCFYDFFGFLSKMITFSYVYRGFTPASKRKTFMHKN